MENDGKLNLPNTRKRKRCGQIGSHSIVPHLPLVSTHLAKMNRYNRRQILRNRRSVDAKIGMDLNTRLLQSGLPQPTMQHQIHSFFWHQQLPYIRQNTSRINRLIRMNIRKKQRNKRLNDTSKQVTNTEGKSSEYVDIGDQDSMCTSCGALLWEPEAIRGQQSKHGDKYGLCCMHGKIKLPKMKKPPKPSSRLFKKKHAYSSYFLKNIRRFNTMFAFTSMGAKIDNSINHGKGPYVFRIHGQNYHNLSSLLPIQGADPKFSQLYIYDTEHEIENRLKAAGSNNEKTTAQDKSTDEVLTKEISAVLDANNVLVKTYRMIRDLFDSDGVQNVKLRLISTRTTDGRTHNLPTVSEVAVLIVGDIDSSVNPRDIVVQTQCGYFRRITELHPSYLPLHYPLLFPFGDDGYRPNILHAIRTEGQKVDKYTTLREYFAYKIQDRWGEFSLLLNARRLFQQFLVDGYTMIESQRLQYIRTQQKHLRCSSYENLKRSFNSGNNQAQQAGMRIFLPSSFTGGARYMIQNYLDAMALCKYFGYPDLFLTVTCNPKWPEIVRFLNDKSLRAEDRPDILCRVFKIKLDIILQDIKENQILGKVKAVLYTIEFQKRGLPHAHICLFLDQKDKMPTVDAIDSIICAELPDKDSDPDLYALVSEHMMHGPCGKDNMKCACMKEGKCSKRYPKKFRSSSSIDADGYPLYRRRDTSIFVQKNNVKLDNQFVVPYNKQILQRYQAHINIEWCNQAGSIKYLFKYIHKGPDRATATVAHAIDNTNPAHFSAPVDEIKEYYDCRYISACEATWRIYGFDIHYRTPSVERLSFHLEGEQQVVYDGDADLETILGKPTVRSSMFLAWMECNKNNEEARELTYSEFPTKFVWNQSSRQWTRRKRGFAVGRIHHVPPSAGEAYYFRILLTHVKGPISYNAIKTVNQKIHNTFKDACYALGLLDDDIEYIELFEDAKLWASGQYLRQVFAMLLLSRSVSEPEKLWARIWPILADDIIHHQRNNVTGITLDNNQIQMVVLFEVEKHLRLNGSSLRQFPELPYPDHECLALARNTMIHQEMSYDKEAQGAEHQNLCLTLNVEQRNVYDVIMKAATDNTGAVFFYMDMVELEKHTYGKLCHLLYGLEEKLF